MEYFKNLHLYSSRSNFKLIFGIIFLIVSVAWLLEKYVQGENPNWFDFVLAAIMFLNGVLHLSFGVGYSLEGIFGKAFIRINDQEIVVKPSAFENRQQMDWREVHCVNFDYSQIVVDGINKNHISIFTSDLDSASEKELKALMQDIAVRKGIGVRLDNLMMNNTVQ